MRVAAEIGYFKINVIDPPIGAVWGTFNDRPPNANAVDKMVSAFEIHVDNCTDSCAMDVAVDPAWLVDPGSALKKVDGLTIFQVPELRFTQEGEKAVRSNNNLWMLSGNHRRLALKRHIDTLKQELTDAKAAMEEKGDDDESSDGIQIVEDGVAIPYKEAEEKVKYLEERIERSSFWAVRAYDRGLSWRAYVARFAHLTRSAHSQA